MNGTNFNKQPFYTAYIKYFNNNNATPFVTWVYQKINNMMFLTPSNPLVPVLIENDLYISGSILNPSDVQLKKHIQNIPEETVNQLLSIPPKQFQWIESQDISIHYGVLAQDVEPHFPTLVKEQNGSKTVNYMEMIPLLLSKIQNLENRIKDLESKTFKLF